MRWLAYIVILLVITVLLGSRLYPEARSLEVSGNKFLTDTEVLKLAGLKQGQPLLWVNPWTLRKLAKSPWISRAHILRDWPERKIYIEVWERQPLATDGTNVWAKDGTILANTHAQVLPDLVQVTGWGESRIDESLDLIRLLAEYEPKVLSYTPEGFEIQLARTVVLTPSVQDLKNQWSGFLGHTGNRISVYAWGVSIDNE
ncbi:MAG: hypothetical protein CMO31_07070 [Trueperaceae bacterium]|jgi:cell division septal protein FtsQ|nr:hypothetical protein [Trueperaceae bacterium]MCH2667904.1 FtsQ-type POTRA domain-containing protein [Deinococcales bacterium]|tara:strand:+ start:9113 stop:9715 length:603 start_codon:yes stop_codon:yes gene_type:complete